MDDYEIGKTIGTMTTCNKMCALISDMRYKDKKLNKDTYNMIRKLIDTMFNDANNKYNELKNN